MEKRIIKEPLTGVWYTLRIEIFVTGVVGGQALKNFPAKVILPFSSASGKNVIHSIKNLLLNVERLPQTRVGGSLMYSCWRGLVTNYNTSSYISTGYRGAYIYRPRAAYDRQSSTAYYRFTGTG